MIIYCILCENNTNRANGMIPTDGCCANCVKIVENVTRDWTKGCWHLKKTVKRITLAMVRPIVYLSFTLLQRFQGRKWRVLKMMACLPHLFAVF